MKDIKNKNHKHHKTLNIVKKILYAVFGILLLVSGSGINLADKVMLHLISTEIADDDDDDNTAHLRILKDINCSKKQIPK